MEDRIIYIAELPYRVDFENESLVRLDRPNDILYAKDMKDFGPHFTAWLKKDTRLPQREFLELDDQQRLCMGVFLPAGIFDSAEWKDPAWVSEINAYSADLKWNIYLGRPYEPSRLAPPTSELLPTVDVEGRSFWLDVERLELRDKANALNTISFTEDMVETAKGYQFMYNTEKNRYADIDDVINYRDAIASIHLPELVKLDPVGMSRKYGLSLGELEGKGDFDVMVDQLALQSRLAGKLVTVDIEGHTFYVDRGMQRLRPEDDFVSEGISFDYIDANFDVVRGSSLVAYNPKTHGSESFDMDMHAVPSGLVLVEIPHYNIMDPVGRNLWSRKNPYQGLKGRTLRTHFSARKGEWKEIGIQQSDTKSPEKIGDNREQALIEKIKAAGKRSRRGRKL